MVDPLNLNLWLKVVISRITIACLIFALVSYKLGWQVIFNHSCSGIGTVLLRHWSLVP